MPMTVCIGALAENKKSVVLATDQMITASIPIPYEFETDDVKKMYNLTDNVAVLTAGNALFAHEIIENSIKAINASNPTTIEIIAEIVRKTYQDFRRNLVIKQYIEPRGLSLVDYYNLQQKLNIGVVQEIENQLTNYNIGTELILAGHNSTDECHIFSVTHPGVLISHDAIGYVCIGSGAPHAMYYIIGSKYSKSQTLKEVEGIVRRAKKKGELAPGVGKGTVVNHLPNYGTEQRSEQ